MGVNVIKPLTISILIEKSFDKEKTFIPWEVVVLFQRIAFLHCNYVVVWQLPWEMVMLPYGLAWSLNSWEHLLFMDLFIEEVGFHLKIKNFHKQSKYVKCSKYFVRLHK
jgi:hypothetical protein